MPVNYFSHPLLPLFNNKIQKMYKMMIKINKILKIKVKTQIKDLTKKKLIPIFKILKKMNMMKKKNNKDNKEEDKEILIKKNLDLILILTKF